MSYRNLQIAPARFKISTAFSTSEVLNLPLQLVSLDGIGYPPVENISVRAPAQHGSTHLGAYLLDRLFSVGLVAKRPWGYALEDEYKGARKQLFDVANPGLGGLQLQVLMSSSDIYTLKDVYYESSIDAGLETQASLSHQRLAVRFIAHDPAWYGKARSVTIDPDDFNTVELPSWNYAVAAENFGNWWSSPAITLTGPMTDPVISLCYWSAVTSSYVELSRIALVGSLQSGWQWYITTEFGSRKAVNGGGYNVDVSDTSTFSTFVLAYSPIRKRHDQQSDANWYNNFIRIVASGCSTVSRMKVDYADRYIGI